MQHIQSIQNHPNRDLILAGAGVAGLLGLYACYRCCCCRKKPQSERKVSVESEGQRKSIGVVKSAKSLISSRSAVTVEDKKPPNGAATKNEEKSGGGARRCPPPQPLGDCSEYKVKKDAAPSKKEEGKAAGGANDAPSAGCGVCGPYIAPQEAAGAEKKPGGAASNVQAEKTPAQANKPEEDGKSVKPYVDGNKYLARVHPPSNLICPPPAVGRVGLSGLMDSRPATVASPRLYSGANTYQRDRWYRGTSYTLPKTSLAFLRASKYPISRPRSRRPGRMLRMMNNC